MQSQQAGRFTRLTRSMKYKIFPLINQRFQLFQSDTRQQIDIIVDIRLNWTCRIEKLRYSYPTSAFRCNSLGKISKIHSLYNRNKPFLSTSIKNRTACSSAILRDFLIIYFTRVNRRFCQSTQKTRETNIEGKAERFNGLLPGKIPATALYAEKYKFEIIPQYRHGPFEMSLHCSFCNIHLCCNFFNLFLLDNMK